MVLRLFGCEAGDGGKDTERVAAKHDYVRRLSIGDTRDFGIRDELDRVGAARVFGDRHIVVIRLPVGRVVHHILEDRAKSDSTKDLGFLRVRQRKAHGAMNRTHLVSGEVDALGVASSLDVEHPGITPHMLVVPNQQPVRICRQSRLARPAQPEEQGDIPIIALSLICR